MPRLNEFLTDIITDAKDQGGTVALHGIVDKLPRGVERQALTSKSFNHRYVEQTHDSYCDTYHGHLYYPIQGGKFLVLEFWM